MILWARKTTLTAFVILPFLLTAVQVEIRAVSDLHGRLENLARLEPLLLPGRADVLHIDAGDTHTGGFAAHGGGAVTTLTILNELNFDCWVPGNHDLELPEKELAAAMRVFRGTVLGAEWHTPICHPQSWRLFQKNGFRIAVIGLTDPGMKYHHYFDRTFFLESHAVALLRVMPEVRSARPDLIVLVRHGGLYGKDGSLYDLLKSYPEIRLVIGGHTHERVPGKRVGRAWFVQPGCHGECVAAITVDFDDRSRQLKSCRSALLPVPAGRSGKSLSPALAQRLAAAAREGKRIAGYSSSPLAWPRSRRDRSASLGLWCAALLLKAVPEAEIACCALPVRKDAPPLRGDVTARMLFRLFPYGNRLRLVELSQEKLTQLLNSRDFSPYAVPFWAGERIRQTRRGWAVTAGPSTVKLLTTEYLAATHSVLRQAPGRTLPLTDLEAAEKGLNCP